MGIKKIFPRRKGASLLGYGLVVGLISVVALLAVTNIGDEVTRLFGSVSNSLGTCG